MRATLLHHVLALAAAGVLCACGGDDGDVTAVPRLTAEPVPVSVDASPTPTPTAAITPTGTPAPTGTATPTEVASRPPGDADRGAFIATFRPDGASDLDVLASDVDRDGESEVVATYLRDGLLRLDVAWWNGGAYDVGTMLDGGVARDVTDVQVRDVNADGLVEIVVAHRGEGDMSALTIWQVRGRGDVAGLIAIGGCHSGRSTYGAIGATLEDRNGDGIAEVYATCDDAPLPRADWSTDRYVWGDGAYRHIPDPGVLEPTDQTSTPAPSDPDDA